MMASRVTFLPGVESEAPRSYEKGSELSEDLVELDVWMDPNWQCSGMARTDVNDFRDSCFLLEGVLADGECRALIGRGEDIGFHEMCGVKTSYRNNGRIMFQSSKLASHLWQRIREFVSDMEIGDDPHLQHVHGANFLLKGKWCPLGLNDVFRFCKYPPGGHFAPHFDGHLAKSTTVRSMKTLMIYLNGDFEGATTNFVDETQHLYQDSEGRYCAEEKNIIYRVKPEAGRAIIFNHHRLHEGAALKCGQKYILRTDIMYEKTQGEELRKEDNEAVLLVQEAERLEASGDNMAAMRLYRRAFKLSPALENSFNHQ